jgi:quercetin dioxygenase-like cupin family protein
MEITNILKLLAQHPEGSFLEYGLFNGKAFGTCQVTGTSPAWEMHPDTDEFFYIIEGTFEITLLEEDGPKQYVAHEGSSFIVPRGIWHIPGAPSGAKFIHFTPGISLHSESKDPREDHR